MGTNIVPRFIMCIFAYSNVGSGCLFNPRHLLSFLFRFDFRLSDFSNWLRNIEDT